MHRKAGDNEHNHVGHTRAGRSSYVRALKQRLLKKFSSKYRLIAKNEVTSGNAVKCGASESAHTQAQAPTCKSLYNRILVYGTYLRSQIRSKLDYKS